MKTDRAVILETNGSPNTRLHAVPINHVSLDKGFWHNKMLINQETTIPSQYNLLETTGRLDNFRRASGEINKPYQGYYFNDSDVYKWLEAAAWSLASRKDDAVQQLVDRVIKIIASAQDKNGYLNSFFSVDKVNERWTNLQEKHELYCAGHLIQAAIAHHRVTGEDKLINIAIRLSDHINQVFGPGGREGTPGHPEIEMALVELYRTTGEKKYLQLASVFIERRGRNLLSGREYYLDHVPFRKLEYLTGHAVRALYLCSGATDEVIETGDQVQYRTLVHLWENMVRYQLYVTGGVGARHDGEAIGGIYELPNVRAYAETCAAVANIMWNWRMLQVDANSRYADLLEWTLYNAALPGISSNGKGYFYINPLKAGATYRRQEWFDCACCPPNISRMIAMFPGYMYSVSDAGIWVHQFAQSRARIELPDGRIIHLDQTTAYPWEGQITLHITDISLPADEVKRANSAEMFSFFIRLPGWLENLPIEVTVNSNIVKHTQPGSYMEINRAWKVGNSIEIKLPMQVKYIESHPFVDENVEKIAISRGPLLYCLEQLDNPGVILSESCISPSSIAAVEFLPDQLGGVNQIRVAGKVRNINQDWGKELYRSYRNNNRRYSEQGLNLLAVPYFAWANREPGEMQVWIAMIEQ